MSKAPSKKTTKARSNKLLHAAAKDLQVHPLLAGLPVLDEVVVRVSLDAKKAKGGQLKDKKELEAEVTMSWDAFVADVIERGIVEALVCWRDPETKKLWILDGRHRFAAAKVAELKKIPYRVYQGDAAGYILGAVCQRYHWTKGQRAYFALHLHGELVDGAKPGPKTETEISDSVGKLGDGNGRDARAPFGSREELAKSIGVSADTIDQAARVHRMFRADKKAKGKYEPLIFAGVSLKGVLAGDGAGKLDNSGGDLRSEPWFRIEDRSEKERKALVTDWDKARTMGNEALAKVKAAFTKHLQGLPDDIREHAREALGE